VVGWFERFGEIPLAPPAVVREYGSIGDDPERRGNYSTAGIRGVAFIVEYFDQRGWTSIRTIRCLGIDTLHPASISAHCHVRGKVCEFRVDRIISISDLRSGRIVSAEEHLALLAPYLPNDAPEPELCALVDLQNAVRDGVHALLQVAMRDGRLADEARDLVLAYVKAEADLVGVGFPAFELVELWIDNLSPPLDVVTESVTLLLEDREKFARLLPWILKVARSQGHLPDLDERVRTLMAEVRAHFRNAPRDRPRPIRVTS
jgi:hypothetical protein